MNKHVIIPVAILLAFCHSGVWAQKGYLLDYQVREKAGERGRFELRDSVHAVTKLNELVGYWREQGYLLTEVQEDQVSDSSRWVTLSIHEKFEWVALRRGDVSDSQLRRAGYEFGDYAQKPVSYQKVVRLFEKLLEIEENEGFPFASVRLDSIRQEGRKLEASLRLERGPYIEFDSLVISGSKKANALFLAKKMKIMPGTPFSQSKLEEIGKLLNTLPYYEMLGPPQVTFQNSQATVYLNVRDRPMNSIDGIIGVLPNEVEENKLLVTGQFDLDLHNVGGRGRAYGLHWQRLSQYSQNLEISALEPQVFGTGIDISGSFFLLKQDTSFVNRDFRLGFGYRVSPSIYLDFFSRWTSGDLLSIPEMEDSSVLPDLLDYDYHNYGLTLTYQKLDDTYMPKAGWRWIVEGGVGNKKIQQNTGIPPSAYEGLDMESLQGFGTVSIENFLPIGKRFVTFTRLCAGNMAGENILKNDMYRLGGLRTIRGFNENFFFTNRYVYANFEPRIYIEREAYFLFFMDMGWLEQKGFQVPKSQDPVLSFGAGINLRTQGGMFRFLYGMGKSSEQKLGVNYAKIHFGYIGRF